MSEPTSKTSQPNGNGHAMIELRDVERHFHVGGEVVRALDGVDLDIASGEYVAVLGSSGSGKSTLMNMLGCLDTPTGGSYRLAGEAVEKLDDDALAEVRNRRIGFVFQTFHLLPRLDALDNVALPLLYREVPRAERRRKAQEVLEQVGLGHRTKHRPNELSGGQCQRVAIARSLITDPAILLADEPTGNLDSKTSDEIMGLFDRLHQGGRTLILVTHEDDVAAHAHRQIRLHDGKVASDQRSAPA